MKRNFSFLFLRRSKFVDEDLSLQSMLLRKALQMQQDLEDKKNEIIIEGLENKIKEYEASLEKKDFLLQAMEGSLAEAQAENTRLNRELLQKSESFEQERKSLQTKYEAEAVENTKLQQSLKELRNMCLGFGSRCVQRLKRFLTQFEPALKSLPLRPKTYQAPSNTLKAKSRRLTK
jgi:chromosome segregation ATPase